MVYYPTPTNNDTKGLSTLMKFVNDGTGGLLAPLLIFALWIIIFVITIKEGTARSWIIASFVTAIISIPMAILNILSPHYMYITFILLAIGLVWVSLDKNSN